MPAAEIRIEGYTARRAGNCPVCNRPTFRHGDAWHILDEKHEPVEHGFCSLVCAGEWIDETTNL